MLANCLYVFGFFYGWVLLKKWALKWEFGAFGIKIHFSSVPYTDTDQLSQMLTIITQILCCYCCCCLFSFDFFKKKLVLGFLCVL